MAGLDGSSSVARYDILYSIPERMFIESEPSLVVRIGHMVTLTPPVAPLMNRAIYGEPAPGASWSPTCATWITHSPAQVRALHEAFAATWKEERLVYERDDRGGDQYASWSIDQIEEVLRAFRHASERGEWIVSAGEVFSQDSNYGARGPGSPPYPARAPCPDTRPLPWRFPFGPAAGAAVLGVLALCAWRSRRLTRSI